jgi:hypothetical protein
VSLLDDSDGFTPVPAGSEPLDGLEALALEEEQVGTDTPATITTSPPVVGRTYALDVRRGRLLPEDGEPMMLRGPAAQRQAIEKCLRTDRSASPVNDEVYGYDEAEREVEGQPFSAEAWGTMEERVRSALITSLPWVLEVEEFNAEQDPDDATLALVSFRVIPDGDELDAIDFDRYPLPLPAV